MAKPINPLPQELETNFAHLVQIDDQSPLVSEGSQDVVESNSLIDGDSMIDLEESHSISAVDGNKHDQRAAADMD